MKKIVIFSDCNGWRDWEWTDSCPHVEVDDFQYGVLYWMKTTNEAYTALLGQLSQKES